MFTAVMVLVEEKKKHLEVMQINRCSEMEE
jgi:hypothetical protein